MDKQIKNNIYIYMDNYKNKKYKYKQKYLNSLIQSGGYNYSRNYDYNIDNYPRGGYKNEEYDNYRYSSGGYDSHTEYNDAYYPRRGGSRWGTFRTMYESDPTPKSSIIRKLDEIAKFLNPSANLDRVKSELKSELDKYPDTLTLFNLNGITIYTKSFLRNIPFAIWVIIHRDPTNYLKLVVNKRYYTNPIENENYLYEIQRIIDSEIMKIQNEQKLSNDNSWDNWEEAQKLRRIKDKEAIRKEEIRRRTEEEDRLRIAQFNKEQREQAADPQRWSVQRWASDGPGTSTYVYEPGPITSQYDR